MITIKEIAKKSGYGVGTVSRALSGAPSSVKQETRRKILAIAEKYGYVKDINAEALITGRSKDIGLIVPAYFGSAYYNDYYIKMIAGIIEAVPRYGHKLRLLWLDSKDELPEIMYQVKSLKLRGLILSSYCGSFYLTKTDIQKFDIPVVVLDSVLEGKNIRSVIIDDFHGGYEGTDFLIRSGHRKIGVVRGVQKDIEKRFEGYKKCMQDNKLKIDKQFVLQADGTEPTAYMKMLKMMDNKQRPTAVFCLDDEMAVGAIRAIRKKGFNCPSDISVLGFDGMDVGNFIDPRLTTMVKPVDRIGKEAVDFLLDERKWKREKSAVVKTELMVRESCGKIK